MKCRSLPGKADTKLLMLERARKTGGIPRKLRSAWAPTTPSSYSSVGRSRIGTPNPSSQTIYRWQPIRAAGNR